MRKYNFYSDPGHAWLEVPLTEICHLNLADKISSHSYINRGFAYLEEDCDAPIFIKAAGLTQENFEEIYQENTPIRCYSPFDYTPHVR